MLLRMVSVFLLLSLELLVEGEGGGGCYEVADRDSYIVLRQKVISENSNNGADSGT